MFFLKHKITNFWELLFYYRKKSKQLYLEKILLKYEKSFTHFNVRNFISILYDRLQEVKDEKLPYIVYEEEEWLEGIIREMFDDKFNLIK